MAGPASIGRPPPFGVPVAALFLVILAIPAPAPAQDLGAISGELRRPGGEPAAGVEVLLLDAAAGAVAVGDVAAAGAALRSAVTDSTGAFRFDGVPAGRYRVRAHPFGFALAEVPIPVLAGQESRVEFFLRSEAIPLPPVDVAADRARDRFRVEAGVTVRELDQAEIKRVPGVAETDVLRAVAVLPGVVTTSDYSSAYNVRGGSSDQNLILLDGIPIYNPFHLGGVFSVFNADMVSRTELYTGGFPSRFGGRVSSVLNVESDAGPDAARVHGGISLLAARAALDGSLPLRALGLERARGRVSVRRSYFDQVMRPAFEFPYHLTDVQGYAEAYTAGGDRINLTGYTGRDVLDLRGLNDFPLKLRWAWGNDVAGGRWLRVSGSGAVETTVGASRFDTALRFDDFGDTEFRSRLEHLLARADGERRLASGGRWRAGGEAAYLRYDNRAEAGGTVFNESRRHGTQLGAYGSWDVRRGRWLLEAGVRADAWLPEDGRAVLLPAPRLAVKRFLGEGATALKLATGRYTQFAHSLRDEELPLGIDIWVLAGPRAPYTVSDQVQGGLEGFLAGGWSFGAEAFYRAFRGVVTTNLADDPNDPLDDLVSGDGVSYGADLYLGREAGRLRPALAASWLRATRSFPDFRSPEEPTPSVTYPPIFDRRLDLDLLLRAELPRRFELSGRLHIGTGLPYTRPLGAFNYYDYGISDGLRRKQGARDNRVGSGGGAGGGGSGGSADDGPPRRSTGAEAVVLGPRNGERYPTYQRLDLSVRRNGRWFGADVTWYVEVLNVLNRRNVLFYFHEYDRDPPVRSGISMFPVLPTVGVEFRF